jgi:steroid 5-alpha reductase family enzyme
MIEQALSLFAHTIALILCLMVFMWALSLARRDASIVDIFWGLGFIAVVWFAFFTTDGHGPRTLLVSVLTTLWGLRLASYIMWRNRGKEEDYRYREMREKYGKSFWIKSLVIVFGLQGALMFIISLPVQYVQLHALPAPIGPFEIAGTCAWAVGFFFETVGDIQLARFRRNASNRGGVLRSGLWAYTRHPNYFGESLMWWGLFIIALPVDYSFLTIISPLTITFLLLRVSGVTLLEKEMMATKPEYVDYVRSTSSFLPWFRHRGKSGV